MEGFKVVGVVRDAMKKIMVNNKISWEKFYDFVLEDLQNKDKQELVSSELKKYMQRNMGYAKRHLDLIERCEDLFLTVRSLNCLKDGNIIFIKDLITKTEKDLLAIDNLGQKSLNEIKECLFEKGLCLMDDKNINELTEYDDPVNHPSHYTQGKVECLDAIDSATSSMQGNVAVYVSNIMKYLWRHHRKHNRPLEDVLKAKFFFDKLIKYYAQNKAKDKQED